MPDPPPASSRPRSTPPTSTRPRPSTPASSASSASPAPAKARLPPPRRDAPRLRPGRDRAAARRPPPRPPHGARGPGHVAFAATAAELDRLRARLVAAGIEIEADFLWPGGARSIYVRDPAGNSVELAEPRLWDFPPGLTRRPPPETRHPRSPHAGGQRSRRRRAGWRDIRMPWARPRAGPGDRSRCRRRLRVQGDSVAEEVCLGWLAIRLRPSGTLD